MSLTRLVATCWASDPDDLVAAVARAHGRLEASQESRGEPHLIEARLDLLARPATPDVLASLAARAPGRLLATCRPGGSGDPGGAARLALLRRALDEGAAGCDLEHDAEDLRIRDDRLLVLSLHSDVAGIAATWDAAQRLARAAPERRALTLKLAFPVETAEEALDGGRRAAAAIPQGIPFAPVAMGAAGTWMRMLAARVVAGRRLSDLAYVAGEKPLPGASLGQPLLRDALGPLGMDRVGPDTRLFGVIGWPLAHTWSPLLHGELFRRRGIDAVLVPLPVPDVASAMRLVSRLELEGVAVTMPHKRAWRRMTALSVSATARRCGAVNTLRRGEPWEAESFDGAAALWALERAAGSLGGRRVAVLGSGGAGAAAADALVRSGAHVIVLGRDATATGAVARALGSDHASFEDAALVASCDAVVNATPVGSAGHPGSPLPEGILPRRAVLDMVTTPASTELLRAAAQAGLATADGLSMLAHQAAAQQGWWLGVDMEPEAAEAVLRALVAAEPA
jgi:shikimate dehydrogenase